MDIDTDMASRFPGFSSKALSFFRQLENNNDRDWFKAHKDIFDTEVRELMVDCLNPILEFAPAITELPYLKIYYHIAESLLWERPISRESSACAGIGLGCANHSSTS